MSIMETVMSQIIGCILAFVLIDIIGFILKGRND